MSVMLSGKEYSTFEDVLKESHKRGLLSISTEMVQNPFERGQEKPDGRCIMKATVEIKEGDEACTYQAYGDATPSNVNKMILPHILRMAETRAIGRALRFAIGAKTLIEELGEN